MRFRLGFLVLAGVSIFYGFLTSQDYFFTGGYPEHQIIGSVVITVTATREESRFFA